MEQFSWGMSASGIGSALEDSEQTPSLEAYLDQPCLGGIWLQGNKLVGYVSSEKNCSLSISTYIS